MAGAAHHNDPAANSGVQPLRRPPEPRVARPATRAAMFASLVLIGTDRVARLHLLRDAVTHPGDPAPRPGRTVVSRMPGRPAIRIASLYLLFGIAWILVSDLALELFQLDEPARFRVALWKGWLFVAASTLVLLVLVQRERRRWERAEQALRSAHRLLDAIVEGTSDAVYAKDAGGRYLLINSAGAAFLGRDPGEVLGRRDEELLPAESAREIRATDEAVMREGRTVVRDEPLLLPAGERRSFEVVKAPLRDEHGTVCGVVGISRDSTERRTAEAALARAREKLEKMFEAVPLAIAVTRLDDGLFLEANPGCTHLFGYPAAELVGASSLALGLWADPVERAAITESLRTGDEVRGADARMRHRDGIEREVEIHAVPLEVEEQPCAIFVGRDVTAERRSARELERLALYDPLTALPNRVLLQDRLGHALAVAGREESAVAVLFIDLDRFKVINDSLGHAAGDRLLVQVAQRFARCFRRSDTVARLGGDEFAALLATADGEAHAARAAQRVAACLEAPFEILGTTIHVTASIGIALSSSAQERPGELLRRADIAMYRAKAAGGARHALFDPAEGARETVRLYREVELRQAIERGELEVHYQPMVQLATGALAGAEALVRWRRSDGTLVAPGEFIPLAEDTGLIVPIGAWVLRRALRDAARWKRERLAPETAFRLSVNVSGRQYDERDFPQTVRELLEETGFPAHDLELEITETVAMRAAEQLGVLRRLGVASAIDDFGTGYSTLRYVQTLEADVLKIDRSFVCDLDGCERGTVLVDAILVIARGLGLEVVAEGIETPEQYRALRALGCERGQGYHFGAALPGAEFESLLGRVWPAPES